MRGRCWRAVLLCGALALFGCAAGEEDDASGKPSTTKDSGTGAVDTGVDPGSDADPETGDDASPPPPDLSSAPTAGGTNYKSAREMFDHVNDTRKQYSTHIPYDGYPWEGTNADSMTWSTLFEWDGALATEAQKEATRLAGGGSPVGKGYIYQAPTPGETMYLTGIDTAKYMVSALSDSATKGTPGGGFSTPDPGKWHLVNNGTYRLAVAYQTGRSPMNHKKKLGVGLAAAPPGDRVWWVLVFGE